MSFLHPAPILFYTLSGILLGLLVWGVLVNRSRTSSPIWSDAPDYLRFGLLLLAVFSLGVFVAFTLEALLFFR